MNMMLAHQLTIDEVNDLQSERFIRIFGNIVEHFPAAAIAILKKRPFLGVNDIIRAVNDFLDFLKPHEKVRILQLYPDIVNQLIYSSQSPLKIDVTGTNHLTVEDKIKIKEVNNQYLAKFGFPFITDDKEKDVNTIFSEIVSRLQNSKEHETTLALNKVKSIVNLRIREIVR